MTIGIETVDGKRYKTQLLDDVDCHKCAFNDNRRLCAMAVCIPVDRVDNQYVIYKELENEDY